MYHPEQKQNLFVAMGNIFHDSRRYSDEQFKSLNLSRPEWLVLAILRTRPDGVNQRFVKHYLGMEKSYFSKLLNGLEDKGYIIREIDTQDRRNRIIKLNKKMKKQAEIVFDGIYELNEAIQKDFSEEEIKTLYKLFERMDNNLHTFIKGKTS